MIVIGFLSTALVPLHQALEIVALVRRARGGGEAPAHFLLHASGALGGADCSPQRPRFATLVAGRAARRIRPCRPGPGPGPGPSVSASPARLGAAPPGRVLARPPPPPCRFDRRGGARPARPWYSPPAPSSPPVCVPRA